MRHAAAIEFIFHPDDKCLHGGRVRPFHSFWRHHPGPEFADDLLSNFGMIPKVRYVELIEQQVGRLGFAVVTRHTILVKKRALRGGVGRWRRRLRCRRRRLLSGNGQNGQHDR